MLSSILDAIGNTPLVEIKNLNPNPRVKIFAKLEYFNPGGSTKDRPALYMINGGEQSGALTPDKTVIEATSGNTGIGLALVCAVKGYRLLLTMSEAASIERRKILAARGAEIRLTPGHLGTDGAIEEVYRLARENGARYFMADQYNNPANWQAHYHTTAPEVWRQTDGCITHLVATMGTSGTLMGMSRRLKEYNPDIHIIGVEPYLGHKIQGLKNMKEAYVPEIFDKAHLDTKINIEDDLAYEMSRRLAREEGLFVGMSSGAAMAVAIDQAQALDTGVIVVILPDGGERYLSTPLFTAPEKSGLMLHNTMSRARDAFAPLAAGKVSMYSCGPTLHAPVHIGECRRLILADLLHRYFEWRGCTVEHVINITDLDDKTIAASEAAGESLEAFSTRHKARFKADLEVLGVKPATHYPCASTHIPEMLSLAERLYQKGFAYEKLRSLYFNISRLPDYGRFSGVDLNKIRLGATVDMDEYEKDNPRDFTLMKRARLSDLKRGLYTQTPWGNVRPSWHLQCAAISMKYLGDCFDLHISGRELIFPHHENQVAISKALTGRPLARFWVDCDAVLPAKTAPDDHSQTLPPLEALHNMGYSGREIRFWLLSTHYHRPLVLSPERLEGARRALKRLNMFIHTLQHHQGGQPYTEIDQLLYDIRQGVSAALEDDLNISAALASLFTMVKRVNKLLEDGAIDTTGAQRVVEAFREIDTVLAMLDFDVADANETVKQLLAQRHAARLRKDWARADQIREQLQQQGVVVRDEKIEGSY